jgi:hypothetical protein
VNLAQTDFVGNPRASLLGKYGRLGLQYGGRTIARDAAALEERHEAPVRITGELWVKAALQSSIVRIRRGLH